MAYNPNELAKVKHIIALAKAMSGNLEGDLADNRTTPTLSIADGNTIAAAGITTTKALTYNGDGALFITSSTHPHIVPYLYNDSGSYTLRFDKAATLTGGAVTGTIYASETAAYKSASVDFTFTY